MCLTVMYIKTVNGLFLFLFLYSFLCEQDQRRCLEWVHDNAAALKVDTSKIMIYGESAGRGSVSNHLVQVRS